MQSVEDLSKKHWISLPYLFVQAITFFLSVVKYLTVNKKKKEVNKRNVVFEEMNCLEK